MHQLENDVTLLHALADAAAEAILPHFRRLQGVENKAETGFDPVTVADREAERAMRDLLARERPDDGVLGEELASQRSHSGRTWVLDPIDGTRGFIAGLPTWGVLTALADEGGARLGMMSQPFVGERFWTDGVAAYGSRTSGAPASRLTARRCGALSEAVIATTSPRNLPPTLAARLEALADGARMIRYGTDCYGYAMLAAGHVDIVLECGLKAVDIAPFAPLIEAAGGCVTDFSGRPVRASLPHAFAGEAIAVGDPSLLQPVLDAIRG